MSNESKEWKTRTIAEHIASSSVVWRAQISTAPDGKQFAGVRKYIKKADGSEIADRSGISFLYDGGTVAENCQAMIDLFTALKGGTVKVGTKKVIEAGKTKVVKTKKPKETGSWVICDSEGNYLIEGGDASPEQNEAHRFADEDAANAYLTDKVKNRKQRALYSVHDLNMSFCFSHATNGVYLVSHRKKEGTILLKKSSQIEDALSFPTRLHAQLWGQQKKLKSDWQIEAITD